ncbi:winged helix-turn-helix transcriptional regulator [Amycolatopsis sp. NPDC051903]|uniref:winged helix-turn-helix transcriptional regulator n=1 Tax=Amycolatopsis sp. NPDC051903 TaxID=3363936 RepID=UPI0037AD840C
MRRKSFADFDCSIAQTLEVVGEWWTLLIVRDLFGFKGHNRFEELQEDLGISRNILTERLEGLIRNGVVEKRAYQENPPRYEYHLTRKGKDLFPIMMALLNWGDKWATGPDGPPVLLHHTTCDHDAHAVATCSHCGEPFTGRTVEGRDAPHVRQKGKRFAS